MHKRLWIVLSVLMVMMLPSFAMADEIVSENAVSKEKIELTAAPPTPLSKIMQVWNTPVTVFGAKRYWYSPNVLFRMLMFGAGNNAISPVALAVVLVFLWWGVRKCIRMLFRAFRKAKING